MTSLRDADPKTLKIMNRLGLPFATAAKAMTGDGDLSGLDEAPEDPQQKFLRSPAGRNFIAAQIFGR